jgi:hypothetical protein
MDPLAIDIGAEIIDLVKRLGDPRQRRLPDPGRRPATPPPAIAPDHPEPPKAA